MSDRERWIVYPILFFAVSLGLKNNGGFRKAVQFETIECNNLLVRAQDGTHRVQIGSDSSGGRLTVLSAGNSRLFTIQGGNGGESSELKLHGARGASVTIVATESGSQANLCSGNLHPQIILGRSGIDETYGLSATQFGNASTATLNETGISFQEPEDPERAVDGSAPSETAPSPDSKTKDDISSEDETNQSEDGASSSESKTPG